MKKLLIIVLLCFVRLVCLAQDNVDDATGLPVFQQGQYSQAVVLLESCLQYKSDAYFELYFSSLLKLKKFDDAEKMV